jgi:hypothetical protein
MVSGRAALLWWVLLPIQKNNPASLTGTIFDDFFYLRRGLDIPPHCIAW